MFEASLINQVHLHCHPVASPEGAIRYSIMVAVLQTEQSRRQNSQQIEAAASCNHPYHIFSNLGFLLKGDMKVQRPAFSNDILSHWHGKNVIRKGKLGMAVCSVVDSLKWIATRQYIPLFCSTVGYSNKSGLYGAHQLNSCTKLLIMMVVQPLIWIIYFKWEGGDR